MDFNICADIRQELKKTRAQPITINNSDNSSQKIINKLKSQVIRYIQ